MFIAPVTGRSGQSSCHLLLWLETSRLPRRCRVFDALSPTRRGSNAMVRWRHLAEHGGVGKRYWVTAVQVATERMLDAEEAGEFVSAIYWADVRDRVIAKKR